MSAIGIASDGIVIDPTHDRRRIRRQFDASGRVHIANFLSVGAERIHRCLEEETPYNLVVNSKEKYFDFTQEQIAAMDQAQRTQLVRAAHAGAQTGFQLYYDNHRMTDEGEPYADPAHFLARVVAFLNGAEFLSFVRDITGESRIARADAQATRYGPGHFLTIHDDGIAGKNRLAAYVLNLTPKWSPDWGGNLTFLDERGHIGEGYVPAFNALNILKVPQRHYVSCVAPYAAAYRYSVAGWLRSA